MAIFFVAGSNINSTISAATSKAVNYSAGIRGGDIVVARLEQDGSGGVVTPPAGWTQVPNSPQTTTDGVRVSTFIHVASDGDAGQTTGNFTWTGSDFSQLQIAAWRGAENYTTLDVNPAVSSGASSVTQTAPTITSLNDGDAILYFTGHTDGGGTHTAAAGTERIDTGTGACYEVLQGSAGAAGTDVITATVAATWVTMTIALRAAPTALRLPAKGRSPRRGMKTVAAARRLRSQWRAILAPVPPPPTQLFLHDAGSAVGGTLPTATISALAPPDETATGAATNRVMDENFGTAQVSQVGVAMTGTETQGQFMRRWITAPLAAQTIPAGNWPLAFGGKKSFAADATFWSATIGVWRPSTGALVGYITDKATSIAMAANTAEQALSFTIVGSAITVQDGDVLVLEIWVPLGGVTPTIYYDGTVVGSASDNAANILAPTQLMYSVGGGGTTFPVTATDTLAAMATDTIALLIARQIADTLSSVSDATPKRQVTRTLTDTLSSVADSTPTVALGHLRTLSDTLSTVTDNAPQRQVTRVVTDTLSAVTDTLARLVVRPLADTLASFSDSIASKRNRVLADTLSAITDTLATLRARVLSDTLVAPSDSVKPTTTRILTDTLVSFGEALAGGRGFTRTAADTLTTASDSITRLVNRVLTDTLTTASDVLTSLRLRVLSDTLVSPSDSIARSAPRTAADTLVSHSDAVTRTVTRQLADTLASFADALVRLVNRVLADTLVTPSDSVARAAPRTITDTLVSPSDSIVRAATFARALTDTLAAVSDALVRRVARVLADTLVAFSESLAGGRGFTRTVSDTLVTPSDNAVRTVTFARTASDTLVAPSDAITVRLIATRPLTDTAAAMSDAITTLRLRKLTDTLTTASDSVAYVTSRQRTLTDTLTTPGDALVRAFRSVRLLSDALVVSPSDSIQVGLPAGIVTVSIVLLPRSSAVAAFVGGTTTATKLIGGGSAKAESVGGASAIGSLTYRAKTTEVKTVG